MSTQQERVEGMKEIVDPKAQELEAFLALAQEIGDQDQTLLSKIGANAQEIGNFRDVKTLQGVLYNNEAEKALIGSLIFGGKNAILGVKKQVKAFDSQIWFNAAHRAIWTALIAMCDEGIDIDIVTLRQKMIDLGELEQVGGVSYLLECSEFVPSAANIGSYLEIVVSCFEKRCLIVIGKFLESLARMELKPGKNVSDILKTAISSLIELRRLNRLSEFRIESISDVMQRVIDQVDAGMMGDMESGGMRKVFSQFEDIGEAIGYYEGGRIYVIGARPAMGKTAFILQEAFHFASRSEPVLFVSREMSSDQLGFRLVSKLSRVPMSLAKNGNLSQDQYQAWADASEQIYQYPIYFLTDTGTTVEQVRQKAAEIMAQHGKAPVIFDDYIQLAVQGHPSIHQAIGGIMKEYKQLAKEFGCPVIILSQLSRSVESRDNKRPLMSDLRESGSMEEGADVVAFLYRDSYYQNQKDMKSEPSESTAEFIIGKNRDGKRGTVELIFRPAFAEFRTK